MHLLSAQNRDEFLAVPQLIRLDYVAGQNGRKPTLLIKGNTLLLKYVVLGARMQLAFALFDGHLLCALRVCDDGDQGGVLWSVVEREQEFNCIRGLADGLPLVVFLFNELAVNVAWNDFSTLGTSESLSTLTKSAVISRVDYSTFTPKIHSMLDQLHQSSRSNSNWLTFEIGGRSDWKPVRNRFITASASASLIDIFDADEGNQQEQFCIWLTDNLQSAGAYRSPQISKGTRTRELTDILLSYEFGSVLIESKTLSILSRECLPDRAKLKRDIAAHIDKAFAQLRGAIRALKSGIPVTNANGNTLNIEREEPVHAIVLIPDLDLIEAHDAVGADFISDFVETTGGFPHLLDISELLRIVQAAEMIAARCKTTTPMMAFDYYLIERLKKAVDAGTLCIEVLLRFEE